MKIWIDLSNSPHALLFEPVVEALRDARHTVELTARDNAQTVELARERWPGVEVIGAESPRNRSGKAVAMLGRTAALVSWCRAHRPDVAFSHNSYAQIVAARCARIPAVTAMDYEHQPANHLAFRLASIVLLPDAMREADVARLGATHAKTRFYPGLKEELYLGDFSPDPEVLARLGVERSESTILVLARTPPTRALYHGSDNPLFVEALRKVAAQRDAVVVVVARHAEQRDALARLGLRNLVVPAGAVDSRALMYETDVVIGAGGTMTREAALMGIPTYSVFTGRSPAVDRWLERQGRLRRVTSLGQIAPIARRERSAHDRADLRHRSESLVRHFTAAATLQPPPRADAVDERAVLATLRT